MTRIASSREHAMVLRLHLQSRGITHSSCASATYLSLLPVAEGFCGWRDSHVLFRNFQSCLTSLLRYLLLGFF